MREDKHARELARLEELQRRAQERLSQRQERVNQRFDRIRERLGAKSDQPNVTQQRIIDEALQLLDEEGLNNLSLRKLAARLDMQAPALYWHFKSKEALIDYMAEAILRTEFDNLQPRQPDETWQDWMIQICIRLRKAMLARRDGGRVVAGAHLYPAVTLMKLAEVAMESLHSTGIELRRANLITSTAIHFVFGNVIEEQAAPSLEQIDEVMASGFMKDYPLMQQSVDQYQQDAIKGYDEFEDSLRLIIH
jgi:TetR/AcrR family tetracycline transcriptional repressor